MAAAAADKTRAESKLDVFKYIFDKYSDVCGSNALYACLYRQVIDDLNRMSDDMDGKLWKAQEKRQWAMECKLCQIIEEYTGRHPIIGSEELGCEYWPSYYGGDEE